MDPSTSPTPEKKPRRPLRLWVYDLLLVYVLIAGAALRWVGINWGEYNYLHPDERFLVWVGYDISPVQNSSEYFDAANSSLNPNNRGHGFYVYGTLPMFLTRYMVEWIYHHSGWQEMTDVGRSLSAAADLLTVVAVYLVAERLYNRRAAILAAAFSAFTVMQIQQAHFFTMDTFFNLFTLLAVYYAVRVLREPQDVPPPPALAEGELPAPPDFTSRAREFLRHPYLRYAIGFGLALGAGMASKLSTYPAAFLLPAAFILVLLRTTAEERQSRLWRVFLYLSLAAVVSLLVFRLFQPYAFSGPGFFGLKPNPVWVANIREQRNQAAGDIDYPPSLQWARRPLWFSGLNLTLWGLGLPLGILAWAGFLWAGWRILKGEWQQHLLLWGWGAFYFIWQSLQFNPTMRYQLPTYPVLAIFAGWALVELYDRGKRVPWQRWAALLAGVVSVGGTLAWAVAFAGIYARPITRVEASGWIFQNIPGPINLHIQAEQGQFNQPVPFPYQVQIQDGMPFQTGFTANASGTLREVYLAHVSDAQEGQPIPLSVMLSRQPGGEDALFATQISIQPRQGESGLGQSYTIPLSGTLSLVKTELYYLTISLPQGAASVSLCGPVLVAIQGQTELVEQALPEPAQCVIQASLPYTSSFTARSSGILGQISLNDVADLTPPSGEQTLRLSLGPTGDEQMITSATLMADFVPAAGGSGPGYTLTLDPPLNVEKGQTYSLSLALEQGGGSLTLAGSSVANEGEWDDGLPVRILGYDGFGGIYTPGLNFNMYWDDNPDKLERFLNIYDQAEYIFISSNRQWGSLPRLPERFPLTTLHYRHLLGCPEERSIAWCYSVAEPGMFQGDLGYELVQVFQSDPAIGGLRINDQFAEEAFTVYDHPKVLIFRRTADYDPARAREILSQANLVELVRITPKRAESYPANLMLPEQRLEEQQAGGTWAELFNREALHNRVQAVGVVVWYLSVAALGLLAYPLLRAAMPGLPDKGYPLARTAGMLVLAYLTWLAGSLRIPFSRLTISLVLAGMALLAGYLAYRQREALRQEWRQNRKYYLLVEGLMLAFFLLFLAIRLGNPDLWHQWKGGEKPMDFSYFNAVLRSTSFPPYDPWYAGGYLNYYYWGFVYVGVLVKWLGLVPSFAYNLILPTLFSMLAMGAFSIAYNLVQAHQAQGDLPAPDPPELAQGEAEQAVQPKPANTPYLAGIAAAVGMAVLGNWGTVRMILRGYETLGIPGGLTDTTGLLTRVVGLVRGAWQVFFQNASLPYGLGDWYWIPSRAIPAPNDVEPITEFPMFTFLYADLHAHMIALPIATLAVAWGLAVVLGRARWSSPWTAGLGFVLGGLAIGALYPTNLSDIYTYLPLGLAALGYAAWRSAQKPPWRWAEALSPSAWRVLVVGAGFACLALLSFWLYQPYRAWYGQPYSQVMTWNGTHTPLRAYLTHWGLFLFVILSWMTWETREWMASTPLSSLRKLKKYQSLISLGVVGLLLVMALLAIQVPVVGEQGLLAKLPIGRGAVMAVFILPLAAWAGILMLRPGMPDAKRVVLFWVGTSLVITLMVELVVVRGDIGRMNTVFKFYLQAWVLLAVSAAAALGWLLGPLKGWLPGWRNAWKAVLVVLVAGAALFPLMAGTAKIKDRMTFYEGNRTPGVSASLPLTLDGMAYMQYARYNENGVDMDLSQDYRAIRWMQENVSGTPVIVEANSRNLYRWYTRFTINSGLPGVVGWEWHQQQQRALNPPEWVTQRVSEVQSFYETLDGAVVREFLERYGVSYVVVGQLEQAAYPGPGLEKFPAFEGVYWRSVYQDGATTIYEVIR